MQPCTFCEIGAGEREAWIVDEDELSLVFLDHRPLFAGHVLVVPREHFVTISDPPASVVAHLFGRVRRIALAVEGAMSAQGTFVAVNNRVSQSVPHLHVHVVPRTKGDGLRGFFWPRHPYRGREEMDAVRDRLREAIADVGPGE